MSDKSYFVIIFSLACITIILVLQGFQLLRVEEGIDKLLENQKSSIVTPTPQKDAE